MAYGYPYQQPNYFNTNYMPPQQQFQQPQMPPQQPQMTVTAPSIQAVPDELTARNAAFPMDGSKAYFCNDAAGEIYTKQLSMADGTLIFTKYVKAVSTAPEYATRGELEQLKSELYDLIGGSEK